MAETSTTARKRPSRGLQPTTPKIEAQAKAKAPAAPAKPVAKATAKAGKVKVPAHLLPLAAEVFRLNTEKNAADRAYEKQRAALLAGMTAAGVDSLTTTNDKGVTLTALVETPMRESVDIQVLAGMVDYETLLGMVTCSKDAVTAHVGTATLGKCITEKPGTRNVSVKAFKG